MKHVSYISIFLSLFIASTCFCQDIQPSDARPLIKIGIILPLSGNLSDAGSAFRDGALLAKDEISKNSACRYELIFEDDMLQSSKVASAANKLLSIDHVDAIVSTWSYGGSVVAPLAESKKIPHFATAWDTAIVKDRKFSFLHLSPPRTFIPMFMDIFQKKGFKKISLLGMNESGSLFSFDEFERLAKERQFEVVSRESFNFGVNDFRSTLTSLRNKAIDALFVNFAMPEIEILLKQMKELHIDIPVTSMTGFEVIENASLAEGKWYVSDSTPPDEFSKKLMSTYHQSRTYGVGNYYDIIRLIVHQSEKFCSKSKPTGLEFINSLNSISDYDSLFGKLTLGDDHVLSYGSVYRMIKNGKRITVTKDEL